jgi:hypothetical protein
MMGLFVLLITLLGGGVSSSDPEAEPSVTLGLLIVGLALAVATGSGYLALGIYRGRLVPSRVALCLALAVLALGIGALLLDPGRAGNVVIVEAVQTIAIPLVLIAALLSPAHRRYVVARRAHLHGAAHSDAAPRPAEDPDAVS